MAAQGLIHLHRSNRMEFLASELASVLRHDPLSPMEEEWVVVQGPGMQRWLSIELSKQLGVWAHAKFPFPRHLVDTAMRSVLGLGEQESALQAGPMLWAVVQELNSLKSRAEFAEIRRYLQSDGTNSEGGERKTFQLAQRIANVYERYTLYRPELLAEWETSKSGGWQGSLWRALTKNYDRQHPGAMLARFLDEIGAHNGSIKGLPRRVCLFGISSLPPIFMRVLSALASNIEVHLFVLSPSREYWADLRRRRREESPSEEEGHALLASLGRLAGDFQQVLEDNAEYQEMERDLYRSPGNVGMLATLQSDILDLRERGSVREGQVPDPSKPVALAIAPDDRSIRLHSCHSPMREIEVLHDQLVQYLEADSSLEARDIVVMTPDIETYAPLVHAVFDSESKDRPRIPYRIADRSDQSSFPVLHAFSQCLDILSGRMTATQVVDLLKLDLVAQRYRVTEDQLVQIRQWVNDSGIRWGVDAAHREAVEQPGLDENTWRFGFDRLLLGYAMEGHERDLFGGVLPIDAVEGSSTELLGRFLDFTGALFRFRDAVAQTDTMEGWCTTLSALLETLIFAEDANFNQHQLVRDTLESLVSDAKRVDFDGRLSFGTVSSLLQGAWQQGGTARGFLAGGVTFCQLMPMRSIPFRVVCVLGMSDGAFPRSVQPVAFDKMASAPKVGDRTPRDDDRYLFLEAILSARDSLLISYVGRSIHNNAGIPPSVLVGELLDVLSDSFTVDAGKVVDRLVTKHPLQPFSPSYFECLPSAEDAQRRLFSYSVSHGQGAESLSQKQSVRKPFLAGPLLLEDDMSREVTMDQLARFFSNPTKHLLEKRLGLVLRDEDSNLQDREPIILAGLDGYRVGESLLTRALQGESASEAYESVRGGGLLPLGAVGQVSYDTLQRAVSRLSAAASQFTEGDVFDSLLVDERIDDTRLTGTIDSLGSQGRVRVAYARLGQRSELGQWIRHLCLCMVAPADYTAKTVLIGRAEKGATLHSVIFNPVANAREVLTRLVKLYWVGQVAPLAFFPRSARAFATKLKLKGADLDSVTPEEARAAHDAARIIFLGNSRFAGEGEDLYVAQVFSDESCLADDYLPFAQVPPEYRNFAQIACEAFSPLLAAREMHTL